jgi:hypothetical protein
MDLPILPSFFQLLNQLGLHTTYQQLLIAKIRMKTLQTLALQHEIPNY